MRILWLYMFLMVFRLIDFRVEWLICIRCLRIVWVFVLFFWIGLDSVLCGRLIRVCRGGLVCY